MKQLTISSSISFEGTALHTGETVHVTLNPGDANTGIVFVRTDLNNVEIPADVKFVNRTNRQTILQKGGASIGTVEHLMASLYALGIDNCRIELDGSEIPILDGSAAPLVALIEKAGIAEQDEDKNYFVLEETFTYKSEDGSEIMAIPSEEIEVTALIDYGSSVLGPQHAHLDKMVNFGEEIASARTFSFLRELEPLLDQGLIKGGDLNNAIVYVDQEIAPATLEKLKKVSHHNTETMYEKLQHAIIKHNSQYNDKITAWFDLIKNSLAKVDLTLSENEETELYKLYPIEELLSVLSNLKIQHPGLKKAKHYDFKHYIRLKCRLAIYSCLNKKQELCDDSTIKTYLKKIKHDLTTVHKEEVVFLS